MIFVIAPAIFLLFFSFVFWGGEGEWNVRTASFKGKQISSKKKSSHHTMTLYYLKNVESASVATALAKYDFPVPGGPYNRKALHGRLLPKRM